MNAEQFLEREGYRRCDIPACNCGSWHRHTGDDTRDPVSASFQSLSGAARALVEQLMPNVNIEACEQFGLDPRKVASVARRISKAAREAEAMGLTVFGGSGTGTLRRMGGGAQNEVACLEGHFDGGDGGDDY